VQLASEASNWCTRDCHHEFHSSLLIVISDIGYRPHTVRIGYRHDPKFWHRSDTIGQHYREVLLSQQMLPAIWYVAGDNIVFQQDSAHAHWARGTIELLQRETPDFISPEPWPPTVRSRTPLITRFWESCSSMCTRWRSTAATGWRSERSAAKCCRHCCQQVDKASAGVCLHEGRRLRTSAVGCFDNGMKLLIDSLCTMCFLSF